MILMKAKKISRPNPKKTQSRQLFIFIVMGLLLAIALLSIYKTVTLSSDADEPEVYTTGQEASAQFYHDIDSSITVESSQDLNPIRGFTFETWFKLDGAVHNEDGGYLINKEVSGSPVFQLYLTVDSGDNDQKIMTYEMRAADTTINCSSRTLTNQITLSSEDALQWHHVAGVIQNNGDMDLFVDGERSVSNTNHVNTLCQNSAPVTIAHSVFGGGFEGLLDNVRISHISRYPNNFTPASRIGVHTTDQYDDVVYYFNESGDGSSVLDSSDTGHTGTVVGTVKFLDVQ